MKLLVSDYDGTFNEDNKLSKINKNIDAVKRFMDNGHIFAFATGRNYESIKKEITKYHIPYNYLICSNGSIVFDHKDNILFQNTLLIEAVRKTLKYLQHFGFVKSVELHDAYGRSTSDYNNVCEIVCTLKFKNSLDARMVREKIAFLNSFSFMNVIIFKEELDKKDGIYVVSGIEGIRKEDIYTIGDASNDKGMLGEFNGFKMPYSYPDIMFSEARIIRSVKNLVRKIERESHE